MIKDYPRCKTCKYYEIWREGLWASCTNENEGMAVSEDPYCGITVPPDFGCVMHEEKDAGTYDISELIKDEVSDEDPVSKHQRWKQFQEELDTNLETYKVTCKALADCVYGGPGLADRLLTNKDKG